MNVVLKWIGYLLGGAIVVVALFLGTTWLLSNQRINRTYEIAVVAPAVPTDAASIAEGERLAASRGCSDCHGADLGGAEMMSDPIVGRLWATNLTSGEGGVGSTYSDEDFARAVWYGVDADGKPLLFMPSAEYHQALDEAHLGRILAYLRSLPAIDREIPSPRPGPLAWVGHVIGFFPLLPVEHIDVAEPPLAPIEVAASVEYGATIGIICTGCHGADLAGVSDPNGAAPNLTPHETGLGGWDFDDFQATLRTGELPDGRRLGEGMPWEMTARLTDVEMQALWAYLSGLDPLPSAVQP